MKGRIMKRRHLIIGLLALLSLGAAAASPAPAQTRQPEVAVEIGHDGHDHDGHDHAPDDFAPDDGFTPEPELAFDQFGTTRGQRSEASLPRSLVPCLYHTQALEGAPSLREHAGLDNQVSARSATVQREAMMVTPDEDRILRRADQVRASIDVGSISDAYEGRSDFLGTRWDPATTTMTVYVLGDARSPAAAARFIESDPNVQVEVVDNGVSGEALASAQLELNQNVEAMLDDLNGNVQWTLDITCGRIMMLAEDAADLDALQEVIPKDIAELVLAPDVVQQLADRNDHHHGDQDGGLQIRPFKESPGTYLGNCTSSIAYTHSNGHEYAVTAAHCLRDLATATATMKFQCNARFVQGGIFISPANFCVRYQMGGDADVAAVAKNSSEDGDPQTIWRGSDHASWTMGGFDDDRSDSSNGDQVCHSGRNWSGTPCGNINGFNGSACFSAASNGRPAYCVNNIITSTMDAVGGDSGATVFTTRGGTRRYAGVVMSSGGWFSHNEDIMDNFGFTGMVS